MGVRGGYRSSTASRGDRPKDRRTLGADQRIVQLSVRNRPSAVGHRIDIDASKRSLPEALSERVELRDHRFRSPTPSASRIVSKLLSH